MKDIVPEDESRKTLSSRRNRFDGVNKGCSAENDGRFQVVDSRSHDEELGQASVCLNWIVDACSEWLECTFPFVDVATITIPPQEFDSAESRAACEALVFTPWHGVKELRPLEGINRMRKAVCEASTQFRLAPRKAP